MKPNVWARFAPRRIRPSLHLFYSMKATRNAANPEVLREQGGDWRLPRGASCIKRYGPACPPERVIFAPVPANRIRNLILAASIQNTCEAARSSQSMKPSCWMIFARSHGRTRTWPLRVNPDRRRRRAMQMGGRSSPFGIDERDSRTDRRTTCLDTVVVAIVQALHLSWQRKFLRRRRLAWGSMNEESRSLVESRAKLPHPPLESIDLRWIGIPYFTKGNA